MKDVAAGPVTEKSCHGCGRTKPVEDFDLKRKDRLWRASRCRTCKADAAAVRARERYAERRAISAVAAEGFPADDFLGFRELACAYKSIRTGRYVKATNTWFHRDAYERLQASNRLVVVMPPGHNKTTFYGIEFATWSIMRDRSVRIGAVQKSQSEARKLISAVQQRLSDSDHYDFLARRLIEQGDEPIVNPLRAYFAREPFKPTSRSVGSNWGADGFRVQARDSGEKDLTMQAFGIGSQVQGGRFDILFLDDVQDPTEAARFPLASVEKLRWFDDVILGRVTDMQKVVVAANFFSPEDFAHRLIAAHPEFDVVSYPALIERWIAEGKTEPTGETDRELTPLWPEFWSPESLEHKRREVGPRTWFQTWMQESGEFEEATFRRPQLEAARDEDYKLGELPPEVSDVFIGCDPAISGYCAIVAWGFERKTKRRFLLDVFNRSGMRNWDNVVDAILKIGQPYAAEKRLRSCIIELASTQASLINHDRLRKQLASLGAKVKVYRTVTGTGARSESDSFDITTLGRLFDEGLITLPYGGTYEDNAKVDAYIEQFLGWRTNPDGTSVKHLVRDMIYATLFSESEAFVLANRPESHVKIHSQVRVPRWARGRTEGSRGRSASGPRSVSSRSSVKGTRR